MAKMTPEQIDAELRRKIKLGKKPTDPANMARYKQLLNEVPQTNQPKVNNVPEGYIPVRNTLSQQGQVGYNPKTRTPTLNGQDLNIPNMQIVGGKSYAPAQSIAQATGMGTGVRNLLQGAGYKVDYDPNTKQVLADGKPINLPGGQVVGGSTFATPESVISGLEQQIYNMEEPEINPYKSQYQQQIDTVVNNLLNFKYNPDTDPAFKQAYNKARRAAREMLNERNILGSSIEDDELTQIALELQPEYEQRAFDRQLQLLELLIKMDDRAYTKYKDNVELEQQKFQREYNKAVNKLNGLKSQVNTAYTKWKDLGYADNFVSAVLGVAPGTESMEARQAREEALAKIAEEERKLEYQKALKDYDYAIKKRTFEEIEKPKIEYENELIQQREIARENRKPKEEKIDYTKNYNDYYKRFSSVTPEEALRLLKDPQNAQLAIEDLGAQGYEMLISSLTKNVQNSTYKKVFQTVKNKPLIEEKKKGLFGKEILTPALDYLDSLDAATIEKMGYQSYENLRKDIERKTEKAIKEGAD